MTKNPKAPKRSVKTRVLDAAVKRMFPPDTQGAAVDAELRRMAEGER